MLLIQGKQQEIYDKNFDRNQQIYKVVRELKIRGANFNTQNKYGKTPLNIVMNAVTVEEDRDATESLLKWGANVYSFDIDGKCYLDTVYSRLKDLVSKYDTSQSSYDVRGFSTAREYVDPFGRTPLHEAALIENIPNLTFLLGHNADVDHQDNRGWTPLHEAVCANKITSLTITFSSIMLCLT